MTTGSKPKLAFDVIQSMLLAIIATLIFILIDSDLHRAIEDNVRMTCADLVSECVVVGTGRPSPAMFIEPVNVQMDHCELKRAIIRKTRHFHSRRYIHERITSAGMIVVVPPRTLPRTATKGNIRRKAVEEAYKPVLDELSG